MLEEILDYCAPSYIEGLSILGGEPFCNLFITLQLVEAFRQRFGHTKQFGYGLAFYLNI